MKPKREAFLKRIEHAGRGMLTCPGHITSFFSWVRFVYFLFCVLRIVQICLLPLQDTTGTRVCGFLVSGVGTQGWQRGRKAPRNVHTSQHSSCHQEFLELFTRLSLSLYTIFYSGQKDNKYSWQKGIRDHNTNDPYYSFAQTHPYDGWMRRSTKPTMNMNRFVNQYLCHTYY